MPTGSKKFDFNNLFTFEMANNHQGSVSHGKKIIEEMGKIAKEFGTETSASFVNGVLGTIIKSKVKVKN